MNDFDSRLIRATVNWMKGPVMQWLNDNKLELMSPSKPVNWKSLTTGNSFAYETHANIEEEKWWPPFSNDAKLYLPLPKNEYPFTIEYSEEHYNFPVSPDFLRTLICYVEFTDLISFTTASKVVFPEMIKHPWENPWDIIERLNLIQSNDDDEIKNIAKEVLLKYPDKVEEYKNGKKGVLSLFMGDVMKAGKGKINPKLASEIVKSLLEN